MKVALINFSGNVGKTTLRKHLLEPRMADAAVIELETINTGGGKGEHVTRMNGKHYGSLQEILFDTDNAIVDIGASNVGEFINGMRQYQGSHGEFDYFIIPVVPDEKQKNDTITTINALAALGVPAKKIRLIFNRVEVDHDGLAPDLEILFPEIFGFHMQEKKFVLKTGAVVESNEVFKVLSGLPDTTLPKLLADDTDYRAKARTAASPDEKDHCRSMHIAKQLAMTANSNMDNVFNVIFK